ncbi:hypothetical protein [Streptomyces sp. NPDC048845]|uniref:hypothetical protein n=1 Tax=Streptomyces sp. NPDC048845 TaxID=3155390 RepID=UPI00341362F4
MEAVGQLVTIAAVLLGAITTHVTTHLIERARHERQLMTRWDEKKLDAYSAYVGQVRASIYAAVLVYEVREQMRTVPRSEHELTMDLTEASTAQGLAFERVMMLAGDSVIEAAHAVQEATAAIGWQARGAVAGTLEEWRELHATAFAAINRFHECARVDLGVSGAFAGEDHTSRGLLLPEARGHDDREGC